MEYVKTYQDFLKRLIEKFGDKEGVVCLLVVNPRNTDEITKDITNNFKYFHARTGDKLDFFSVGYSPIENRRGLGRFDDYKFVEFIDQLEKITTWRYNSGVNFLILKYKDFEVCFDEVYNFDLYDMASKKLITNYRFFIEELIRAIGNDKNYNDYLAEQRVFRHTRNLWEGVKTIIPTFMRHIFGQICEAREIEQYFAPHNYDK